MASEQTGEKLAPTPYQNPSDLKLLQDFNAAAIAETGGCGYVHPGELYAFVRRQK